MEIRRLSPDDLGLIGSIDRSEEIRIGYEVVDGSLVASEVHWVVPAWSRDGPGDHTVAAKIDFCRPILDRGGVLLGAFEDGEVGGVAIVEPGFEPGLAWLAFLHVGRPHRRRGMARALWDEAERLAIAAGARSMYVSATPSDSAVGFYTSRGCVLAAVPHPVLHAEEPEDIHLICDLRHTDGASGGR